jgi:hypothetical protein
MVAEYASYTYVKTELLVTMNVLLPTCNLMLVCDYIVVYTGHRTIISSVLF